MVDFNKKVFNSDKFRGPAIFFQEHGCYTLAPRGTTDYVQYWDQETKRCLNGYVAPDGDAITGYHYFYLNYSPIMKIEEVEYIDKYKMKKYLDYVISTYGKDFIRLYDKMDKIPE